MGPDAARLKLMALAMAQPLNALLELTYACNWRCVFCFNPRHHDLAGLAAREWCEVVDGLREAGSLFVTLTGGEPLAHPGFFQIARYIGSHSLALRIFSNGSLIGKEEAREIRALAPLGVEMSLHGALAKTHDKTTGVPGSQAAMLRGLEHLRAAGVQVVLKTPLTKMNESELESMIELAAFHRVPYQLDPNLTPRDDGDRGPLRFGASEEGQRRVLSHPSIQRRFELLDRQPGNANCGVGTLSIVVDPEGEVYPCHQWRHRSMGNVRHQKLAEIWRTSRVRIEASRLAVEANDVFAGSESPFARVPFCPAVAYLETGNPLVGGTRQQAFAQIYLKAGARQPGTRE